MKNLSIFLTPRKTIKVPLHQVLTRIFLTRFHFDLIRCNFNNIPQLILHFRKSHHPERIIFVFKLTEQLPDQNGVKITGINEGC